MSILLPRLTCINRGLYLVCDPKRRFTQCLVLFKLQQPILGNKSKFDEQVNRRPTPLSDLTAISVIV